MGRRTTRLRLSSKTDGGANETYTVKKRNPHAANPEREHARLPVDDYDKDYVRASLLVHTPGNLCAFVLSPPSESIHVVYWASLLGRGAASFAFPCW